MECGAQIEELGWRQGCFLPFELVASAQSIGGATNTDPKGCFHIVVTQSCDLVNNSPEDEPWCEVLCLRPIAKLEALREDGRNPRFLHLTIQQNGINMHCEAAAKDRLFLPRKLLAEHPPLTTVEIENHLLESLTDWLAKRYSRPALPTTFNRRLKAQETHLKRLIDGGHGFFRDFYLRLSTFEELPEEEPYRLKLLLVAYDELLQANKNAVDKTVKSLEEILKKCKGVDVVEVKLQSDAQTSLKALDEYLPWDTFDYLTVRDE